MKFKQDINPKQVSSSFIQLYKYIQYCKMDDKNIADVAKLVNEYVKYLLEQGTRKQPYQDHIQIVGRKPINQSSDEKKPWNNKLIRKLLFTVTMVDPEPFTLKGKLVIYTGVFVEFYN